MSNNSDRFPGALVDPGAIIADDVVIKPFAVVGADVELKSGCYIDSHAVVRGPSVIGENNRLFPFASLGEATPDKKYQGEPTTLVVGNNNIFREGATAHRGTIQDNGTTIIGNNNLFLAYAHIGHDCVLGNDIVMVNNSSVAGHVIVGDGVNFGGYSGIHQFCRVGAYSMIGAMSLVVKDVPACVTVQGNIATASGMNIEGMRRRGMSKAVINTFRKAYKVVYREGHTVKEALPILREMQKLCPEIAIFIDSVENSTRGIVR